LAAAAVTGRTAIPALLTILAIGGAPAGAGASRTPPPSPQVWPWTIAALLALLVAGRLLAARVWPTGSSRGMGAAHVALAAVLIGVVAFSIPSWLTAVSDPPVDPWQSPWMWLGTVASILLGAALLVPRVPELDRTSMA